MTSNIGKKLKELREETGLSQEATAKGIGISQSALARYELNVTEPRASDIALICKYFKIMPNDLFDL